MKITYYQLPTVDSTNSFARRTAPQLGEDECVVITADEQTGGYGRLHRSWLTPKATSLALTFLFFQNALPLFAFSQLASLACQQVLACVHPEIKWPNDILIQGKKIAGILTETTFVKDKRAVIVGIGMNVNVTEEVLQHIPRKTTSLLIETGEIHSIPEIQDKLVQMFYEGLSAPLSEIQSRWEAEVAWMVGTHAQVQTSHAKFEGIISKIEQDGTLEVTLQDGTIQQVFSGDLT